MACSRWAVIREETWGSDAAPADSAITTAARVLPAAPRVRPVYRDSAAEAAEAAVVAAVSAAAVAAEAVVVAAALIGREEPAGAIPIRDSWATAGIAAARVSMAW